jgi:hypothetical protein
MATASLSPPVQARMDSMAIYQCEFFARRVSQNDDFHKFFFAQSLDLELIQSNASNSSAGAASGQIRSNRSRIVAVEF